MARSRFPSLFPTIQILLRCSSASIEIGLLGLQIVLNVKEGIILQFVYCAAIYSLILDAIEITGLVSTHRHVPRVFSQCLAAIEVGACGLLGASLVQISGMRDRTAKESGSTGGTDDMEMLLMNSLWTVLWANLAFHVAFVGLASFECWKAPTTEELRDDNENINSP